ncbi:unnamed protein product [marine sediment metagenome]|uniref:Uncharacterized protein n=1 Tax=marine sediment metagenome TaxID=412755 RepID=X1KJV8_9ZZZZ
MKSGGAGHRGFMPTSNPSTGISIGDNPPLETPAKGYMVVEDNPGPPVITGNPNSSDIGDWLQQNWKPLFLGIGIAAFLFWIFSSKK